MNVDSVNASETPVRTGTEGLVAVGRRAWSAVGRLALVAGLAVALLVGALALGPSAGAVPQIYTCDYALELMEDHLALGQFWSFLGDHNRAWYHYDLSWEYLNYC
jgi:hypothetical protein